MRVLVPLRARISLTDNNKLDKYFAKMRYVDLDVCRVTCTSKRSDLRVTTEIRGKPYATNVKVSYLLFCLFFTKTKYT